MLHTARVGRTTALPTHACPVQRHKSAPRRPQASTDNMEMKAGVLARVRGAQFSKRPAQLHQRPRAAQPRRPSARPGSAARVRACTRGGGGRTTRHAHLFITCSWKEDRVSTCLCFEWLMSAQPAAETPARDQGFCTCTPATGAAGGRAPPWTHARRRTACSAPSAASPGAASSQAAGSMRAQAPPKWGR